MKTDLIIKPTQENEGAFFVYDTTLLSEDFHKLKDIWTSTQKKQSQIFYSLKSNPNPHLLKHLLSLGSNFDVSSYNELNLLKTLKIPPDKISISGPAKTESLLKLANEMGVHALHLDSLSEIQKVNTLKLNKNIQLTLRLTIDGLAWKKLGMSRETIEHLLKNHRQNQWSGFHLYLGREMFEITEVKKYIDILKTFMKTYSQSFNGEAIYFGTGLSTSHFYQNNDLMKDIFSSVDFPIHAEAGRFIVNRCGSYYAKVLSVKQKQSDIPIVIINGGLQHHAANLASTKYGLDMIECHLLRNSKCETKKYNLHGSLGTRNDRLLTEISLPSDIKRGDWICLSPCGAYGFTAGTNQFISPDPIREFLFDGDQLIDISPNQIMPYPLSFNMDLYNES